MGGDDFGVDFERARLVITVLEGVLERALLFGEAPEGESLGTPRGIEVRYRLYRV